MRNAGNYQLQQQRWKRQRQKVKEARNTVFEILGQEVPDKEMQRAESYADRKLERATEMQPEDAATYRSGWYRALLVADLVKQLAFQDFTLALCELRNYEPKGGIQTNANT